MINILIILLGCNIVALLHDRIHAALSISSNYTKPHFQVDWFLSGGIKDPTRETMSEAEKMHQAIAQHNSNDTDTWNYIYDTNSQNTAENFIMVDQYLKTNAIQYDRVYVVTSQFHYERAKQFQTMISPDVNVEWVLSPMKLPDSNYWENIHIKNVEEDVERAIQKFYHVR